MPEHLKYAHNRWKVEYTVDEIGNIEFKLRLANRTYRDMPDKNGEMLWPGSVAEYFHLFLWDELNSVDALWDAVSEGTLYAGYVNHPDITVPLPGHPAPAPPKLGTQKWYLATCKQCDGGSMIVAPEAASAAQDVARAIKRGQTVQLIDDTQLTELYHARGTCKCHEQPVTRSIFDQS